MLSTSAVVYHGHGVTINYHVSRSIHDHFGTAETSGRHSGCEIRLISLLWYKKSRSHCYGSPNPPLGLLAEMTPLHTRFNVLVRNHLVYHSRSLNGDEPHHPSLKTISEDGPVSLDRPRDTNVDGRRHQFSSYFFFLSDSQLRWSTAIRRARGKLHRLHFVRQRSFSFVK